MKRKLIPSLIILFTIGLASILLAKIDKKPLTVEDFFRNPTNAAYRLSPDGKHLSYLAPTSTEDGNTRLNIHIKSTDNLDADPTCLTQETARDIRSYSWVKNNILIYRMDNGGDEYHHLKRVDINKPNEILDLTPFDENPSHCRQTS